MIDYHPRGFQGKILDALVPEYSGPKYSGVPGYVFLKGTFLSRVNTPLLLAQSIHSIVYLWILILGSRGISKYVILL